MENAAIHLKNRCFTHAIWNRAWFVVEETTVRKGISTIAFAALLAAVFAPPLYRAFAVKTCWDFALPRAAGTSASGAGEELYREGFIQPEGITPVVHSASVVETGDGGLLAVWYGGRREGARDVALYAAALDGRTGDWSEARRIVDVAGTQADLGRYIRKIGNPVLGRDREGRIWLFYVSVSVGGWSGSAVNYRVSGDGGLSWSPARRLVLSPFFNVGTLVRNAPVLYADGGLGLPVYNELFGKFGEFARLGRDGSVLDKSRITRGRSSLQPCVVPLDRDRAVAFLRRTGSAPRHILFSETGDGGRRWSAPGALDLPNPDSAVMALRSSDGTFCLVFNNAEKDRDSLALALSGAGRRGWEEVYLFENEPAMGLVGFSYPAMVETGDGVFHLLYTWDRKRIKHVLFNRAWLEEL